MEYQTNTYIFLGFLVSLIALMFILLAYYYYKQESNYKKSFNYQANKRNGKISKATFLSNPKLEFKYKQHQVELEAIVSKASSDTIIKMKLSNPTDYKMTIYKESFVSKIGKILGMKDITVRNSDFDNNVILKGSNEDFIRKVLSYNMQDDILRLIKKYKLIINLNDDYLSVSYPETFKDEKTSDEIIDFSLRLVDKIEEILKQ